MEKILFINYKEVRNVCHFLDWVQMSRTVLFFYSLQPLIIWNSSEEILAIVSVLIVISGLESRYNSVKQNNERNKVIMFILQLLLLLCVKQKSKAKRMVKKARIIQCAFYSYSASAAEGGPSFDNYLLQGSTGKCLI